MTATLEHLLAVTKHQVGNVEHGGPHGNDGNISDYWTDLIKAHLADRSFQGQPWCAGLIEWEDWKAGTPLLPIQNPYYCPSRVVYAKEHGLWDESGLYNPGDEVYFSFDGSGVAEHVERVLHDDGHVITTIGGNTSPEGSDGSQANGGGVYLRHRPHGSTVLGVLSYSRLLEHHAETHPAHPAEIKLIDTKPVDTKPARPAETAPAKPVAHKPVQPPRKPIKHNPYPVPHRILELGCKGEDVKWLQWAVGLHGDQIDGEFYKQTLSALLHFQRYHKDAAGRPLVGDGQCGAVTRTVAAKVTH